MTCTTLTKKTRRLSRDVLERVKATVASYRPMIDPLIEAFNGHMDALRQTPIVMYASRVVGNAYDQFVEVYKLLDVEVELRAVLRRVLQHVDRLSLQLRDEIKVKRPHRGVRSARNFAET